MRERVCRAEPSGRVRSGRERVERESGRAGSGLAVWEESCQLVCGNVRAEGGHGQGILRDGGRVKTNQPFQILDPAETLPFLIQIFWMR